jgi:LPXTG-site transpeptidase (sortase) family protein
MTAAPRRGGVSAACGLAAVIVTVFAVLAGESPAFAATGAHSPRPRQAAAERGVHHDRTLMTTATPQDAKSRDAKPRDAKRPAAKPGDAKRPAAKPRDAKRPAAKKPKPGRAKQRPASPSKVSIPSIGAAADLMTLGGPAGKASPNSLSLPVPPLTEAATRAGWYKFTPVPGNAVIVGHVDTYIGPGVFYNLYQLRPGDAVYVNAGGTRRRFDVTSVRELPKASFPVNQVFGSTKKHMLWLITCGGAFNYETRHYLDNIVVSAVWVPSAKKNPGSTEKVSAKRSAGHR